jgi:hypothetical protein
MGNKIHIDPMQDMTVSKKSKKAVDLVVLDAEKTKHDNVVVFDEADVRALGTTFNLDFDLPKDVRMDRVARHLSQSAQYMLAAGVDLLSLRGECAHGEYLAMLEERGIEARAAQRAIQYTQFLLTLSEHERERMLALPKSHVLTLASADPEVVEDLLGNPDQDLKLLSVRELRETIKDLSSRKTDMATQLEKSELEIDRLQKVVKDLRESRVKTGGDVPIPVQDFRLECAALHKKADLAVDDMSDLMLRFLSFESDGEWNLPVARHLTSALTALHAKTGGILAQLRQSYEVSTGVPDVLDLLSPEEVLRCGQEYKTLIDEHNHEKTVREWEREMDRPKGAGRPKAKPVSGK